MGGKATINTLGLGRSSCKYSAAWCPQLPVGGTHANGFDVAGVILLLSAWILLVGWVKAVCSDIALGFSVQILGNNECFEPYTSNIYVRRVLSGEFTVVNQHLLSDLTSLGLWSADTKNELVAANGSVQVLDDTVHSLSTL